MLYTGMERIETAHLRYYDEVLENRMRRYVDSEKDNRQPLASAYTYKHTEPLCPPNQNMVATRWAIAVGYTKPEHITYLEQLLLLPDKDGCDLVELQNDTHYIKLAALKYVQLSMFFTVVDFRRLNNGRGTANV